MLAEEVWLTLAADQIDLEAGISNSITVAAIEGAVDTVDRISMTTITMIIPETAISKWGHK